MAPSIWQLCDLGTLLRLSVPYSLYKYLQRHYSGAYIFLWAETQGHVAQLATIYSNIKFCILSIHVLLYCNV